MYEDEEGFIWGERGDPIGSVYLYTNRSLMVFTPEGYQIPEYQVFWNEAILKEIISRAAKFYIAQWKKWQHEITKAEFCALVGVGETP